MPKTVLLTAFAALSAVLAQPPRAAAPADTTVSPEVHPDHTVTFRIRAPKANAVTLFGAWMPVGSEQPMTKDSDGVWSVTAGPLEPNVHLYTFTVDGVTIADPVNPNVKLRQRTSASLVEVPADPPAPWEARDVPHGTVELNWHRSAIAGDTRQTWVYLPPGYPKNPRVRYPVLYLFHGTGDVAVSWIQAGHANFILDSLIAAGKAVPMIIVMPLGHAVPYAGQPYDYPKNTALFEQYVEKELMPWVESKYRIAPGARNRAIAGLSMGGGQAAAIGFKHLGQFGAIGVFSSSGQIGSTDPAALNKLKLLWLGVGREDGLFERARQFHEALEKAQIRHTWLTRDGMHTWAIWRWCLTEFTPLLFHGPGA